MPESAALLLPREELDPVHSARRVREIDCVTTGYSNAVTKSERASAVWRRASRPCGSVVKLLANPDQLKLLLDDPSLLPNAVDEANRLTAPIQFAFREATEDTVIADTTIPKGAIVALHMAAANRDPRRFDDPDRFLINRPAAKNLAFGHGIHFCLGAHLAGQEVRAAIGGLLPHLDRLNLTDAPLQRNPSALLNGWQRVELAWVS
jgi:cytochrome P450